VVYFDLPVLFHALAKRIEWNNRHILMHLYVRAGFPGKIESSDLAIDRVVNLVQTKIDICALLLPVDRKLHGW